MCDYNVLFGTLSWRTACCAGITTAFACHVSYTVLSPAKSKQLSSIYNRTCSGRERLPASPEQVWTPIYHFSRLCVQYKNTQNEEKSANFNQTIQNMHNM